MWTVHELSEISGVTARALRHYDAVGLLKPTEVSAAGYRLYDDTALERLQQILLFRELEIPLKEIKEILSEPGFDKGAALEQQINLLTMKKERLENLISFARGIQFKGVKAMDFSVFDTKKIDEYAKQAKEKWGHTAEYKESEKKRQNRSDEQENDVIKNFMHLFEEFGAMKKLEPKDSKVQAQAKKLQDYITQHFYKCSNEILLSLGQMYAECGEFTDNIDSAGGAGTAEFTAEAIRIYCKQ